jgi:hypothetical protein
MIDTEPLTEVDMLGVNRTLVTRLVIVKLDMAKKGVYGPRPDQVDIRFR